MPGRNIFICYRRDDSAGDAGRLYDRLNQRFPGRVFMDVAGISLATRWAETIERSLRDCAVIVVLIGKRWQEVGPDGVRRLDHPDDPIRKEILTALRLGTAVVPLAVSGAAIPDRKTLPPDLAALVDWQAHRIDHDDFDHDSTRLIRQLEQALGEPQQDLVAKEQAQEAGPQRGGLGQLAAASGGRAARAAWFGLTLGSLKLWVTVGMAAMAFVAIGVGGLIPSGQSEAPAADGGAVAMAEDAPTEPAPAGDDAGRTATGSGTPSPGPGPAKRPLPKGGAAAPAPKATTGVEPDVAAAGRAASIAGDYVLTGYAYNGLPMALNGTLTFTRAGSAGRFRFRMALVDGAGTRLTYNGTMQREDGGWLATVANSNDPAAVYTPIPTEIVPNAQGIRVRNALGQDAIWQRQ